MNSTIYGKRIWAKMSPRAYCSAIDQAGLRATVKVLVGGAPVTEEFAFAIGADGSAENAGAAVGRARELLAVR